MSLITCKDCGNQFSNQAKACPKCGRPKPKYTPLSILLSLGFLIAMYAGCNSCLNKSSEEMDDLKTSNYEKWRYRKIKSLVDPDGSIDEVEDAAARLLKDPESFLHIATDFHGSKDTLFVSMDFRAKNSFGGYVIHKADAKIDLDGRVYEISLR